MSPIETVITKNGKRVITTAVNGQSFPLQSEETRQVLGVSRSTLFAEQQKHGISPQREWNRRRYSDADLLRLARVTLGVQIREGTATREITGKTGNRAILPKLD